MPWADAARWLALAGGIAFTPALGAQSPSLGVRRIGTPRVAVEAGTQATLAFRVTNRSSSDRTVDGRIALPDGWSLVIPEVPFALAPEESELRLVRVSLPAAAIAGVYAVRYALAGTSERDSVLVTVPATRRLDVAVLQVPRFVTAGDRFAARFVLRNRGNVAATAHLSLSESAGASARLDSSTVRLAPGGEAVVRADVESVAAGSARTSLRVRLLTVVDDDTSRIEPVAAVVRVIPRAIERAPRFRTIGSELTLRQVDGARRPAVELRGGGPVASGGDLRTEFLFRTPSDALSLSGEQDQYTLALSSRRLQLQLGDQSAPYARLGQSWRSGFGVSGQLDLGAVSLGAFDRRDRRSAGQFVHEERGASLDIRPRPQALVGALLLTRSGSDAADLWTLRTKLLPSAAFALDAEMSRGQSATGDGTAYMVALTGASRRASYAARRLVSDSGFPGLTRGMTSSELTGTVVPISRLTLTGTMNDWIAERRSALGPSAREHQQAVEGRIAWGALLDAGYRHISETRFVAATLRDRTTESARLQAAIPLGVLRLRGRIEQGVSRFAEQGWVPLPFRRLGVGATLTLGESSLTASTEWLTGMPPASWVREEHVQVAINAQVRLTPWTQLSASFAKTSYAAGDPRAPMTLDLTVSEALPFGHRAAWQTRAMSYGPSFPAVPARHQLNYVIPVGLPVGQSDASGTVIARVVDRDAERPVAGVLLRMGDQSRLTNEAGEATFTRLTQDVQYLELERATLGLDRMVLPAGPVAVRVHAGSTETVDLAVRRSARLTGSARRFEARPAAVLGAPAMLEDSGAVAGAILQLANESDTLRTTVDASGRFTFAEVAPGAWTLSVVRADLAPHRRFEDAPRAIVLRGGETGEVALRVVPAAQQIQVIDQAELSLDGTSRAPSASAGSAAAFTRWVAGRRRIVPRPGAPIVRIVPEPAEPTPRIVPPPDEPTRRIVPPPANPQWDSRARRIVPPPKVSESTAATVRHHYTVTRWDRSLMQIARAVYGDDSLWPKIWLANPDLIDDPAVMHPGDRLRIPDEAPLTDAEREAGERYMSRGRRIP